MIEAREEMKLLESEDIFRHDASSGLFCLEDNEPVPDPSG